jgi:hypothetical protein
MFELIGSIRMAFIVLYRQSRFILDVSDELVESYSRLFKNIQFEKQSLILNNEGLCMLG